MEIPLSARATINPGYDHAINGPIEFHIPEQGQWELDELIASQTKITTYLGENGVSSSIHGDNDCGEEACSDGFNPEDCDKYQHEKKCQCLHRYFDFHCSLLKHWCEQRYLIEVEKSDVWYKPIVVMDPKNFMDIVNAKHFPDFTDEDKAQTRRKRYYTEISDDPSVFNQEQDALETIIKPGIVNNHKKVVAFRDALRRENCSDIQNLSCEGKGNWREGLDL
jgi:hypothetical protein